MNQQAIANEALSRAQSNQSLINYPAIYEGFAAKGIPENEIEPRVNVLTYHAWRAVGRQVRKGEHGVKVVTWIVMEKEDKDTGEIDTYKRPKSATVFHISQTDSID
ncbi:MAG: ArdC family protein [Planctomycetes bacterium]|nr:ArdC family protein [Planctomycetota bacterium]